VAAVFLWLVLTLPPRPAAASGTVSDDVRSRTVAGAIHVHSRRSDGAGDRDAIAAAAAEAGLQFVIVTDHGDATREPDRPAYLHGVLCLDAVEVSTNGGHVLALGMPAAPYPLGGEADEVVEDIVRLGGFPVAAHPDSPKLELAWTDWSVPVAGLEWLSLDSAWRRTPPARLARVAFHALVRPGPALASILDRPTDALSRWDALTAERRVIGVAGHDAHGGVRGAEDGAHWTIPGASSYAASFAAFSTRVIVARRLTGSADDDGESVVAALRAGRVFTSIDGTAGPAFVDFHGASGAADLAMGDERPIADGASLTLASTAPPGTAAVLLRDGGEVMRSDGRAMEFRPSQPGAYRVELRAPGSAVPWVATNPIYLRGEDTQAKEGRLSAAPTVALDIPEGGQIEKDPGSTATLASDSGGRSFAFRLRAGERVSQYVALAVPLPSSLPAFDAIGFGARSAGPMRVSVQLRFESARWRRSVYLSDTPGHIVMPTSRLVAADRPGPLPPVSTATSLLFVVDLTNARPGDEGSFEISNLQLLRTP
jgi:hypothetical protein